MKHRLAWSRRESSGELCGEPLSGAHRPDKTRYAGSTAFGGHRLQFRENESERIVGHACTGLHTTPSNHLISINSLSNPSSERHPSCRNRTFALPYLKSPQEQKSSTPAAVSYTHL